MQDTTINGVEMCSKKDKLTFVIDIQCLGNATWQGFIIWNETNKRYCFRSALELVKSIDSLLCSDAIMDNEEIFDIPIQASNRRKKASFAVELMYQQHTTWQGLVTWLDKDKKQFFRSTLELMRLIDSTLKPYDVRELVNKLEVPAFPYLKTGNIGELQSDISSV